MVEQNKNIHNFFKLEDLLGKYNKFLSQSNHFLGGVLQQCRKQQTRKLARKWQ